MASRVRSTVSAPARRAGMGAPAKGPSSGKDPRPEKDLPSGKDPHPWKWIWLFCGALALALIAFEPALGGDLVFDDYHLPFADPHAGQMPAKFWIGGVRPLLIATY